MLEDAPGEGIRVGATEGACAPEPPPPGAGRHSSLSLATDPENPDAQGTSAAMSEIGDAGRLLDTSGVGGSWRALS